MTNNKKRPLSWIPTSYFAMGLPFVVLNMVVVLMFKGLGINDAKITYWTSLIMLPWTIKFLWSPFLELFKSKKILVVLTQLISGVCFALLAFASQLNSFFVICIAILFIIALSGATHDVALDGLYMAVFNKEEQAKYIGFQGAFYNLAKLVATGLLVYLAGVFIDNFMDLELSKELSQEIAHFNATQSAWGIIMFIIAILLCLLSLYHQFTLPLSKNEAKNDSKPAKEILNVITSFFSKKHIWIYILFIILYRLGEGFVMKIVPLFLKSEKISGGLGLGEKEIGLLYGTFGAAAFILGSIIAGNFISKFGLKKTLFPLVCIFNLPFLVYTYFAWVQPSSIALIGTGIVLEYFGYGFGFVGLTLFMMQEIAPGKHQMAHYAFASGIMNLSVMLTGMVSGTLSDFLGYKWFFTIVIIAIIPIMILTIFLPWKEKTNN